MRPNLALLELIEWPQEVSMNFTPIYSSRNEQYLTFCYNKGPPVSQSESK